MATQGGMSADKHVRRIEGRDDIDGSVDECKIGGRWIRDDDGSGVAPSAGRWEELERKGGWLRHSSSRSTLAPFCRRH
jgi:hypothetical protein